MIGFTVHRVFTTGICYYRLHTRIVHLIAKGTVTGLSMIESVTGIKQY